MGRGIQIAGGGLAGLGLGVALRRRNVEVEVVEAGSYPRHRVCGEFINGRGIEVLVELGLLDPLIEAGGIWVTDAAFFNERGRLGHWQLPEPALAISRHRMDGTLAERFVEAGGRLVTGQRVETGEGAGKVRATGRRSGIKRGESFWVGVKAHATQVPVSAGLEMHLRRNGYVGLCHLGEGLVNVCGLFRCSGKVPALRGRWREWLVGRTGTVLAEKLGGAEWRPESVCFTAALPLHELPDWRTDGGAECTVGDAMGMVPPITGNGMSLAFESARVWADPLAGYGTGGVAWTEALAEGGGRAAKEFGGRFKKAQQWHRLVMGEPGRWLLPVAARVPGLFRCAFAGTR